MRRNGVQDAVQHAPQHGLDARLGDFDEPKAAASLRQPGAMVVLEPQALAAAQIAPSIGEPLELTGLGLQQLPELGERGRRWDGPRRRAHGGREGEPAPNARRLSAPEGISKLAVRRDDGCRLRDAFLSLGWLRKAPAHRSHDRRDPAGVGTDHFGREPPQCARFPWTDQERVGEGMGNEQTKVHDKGAMAARRDLSLATGSSQQRIASLLGT
jgi:hypothetical protein